MLIEGNIISGEFDKQMNEFYLQKVKYFETESTLKENQLQALYNYLKKHQYISDGQIITLDDKMLLRLTQKEINFLIADLEKIQSMYQ
jgi:hypothetical protein